MNETEAFLSKCHKILALGKFKFVLKQFIKTFLYMFICSAIFIAIDLLKHNKQASYFTSNDFAVDILIYGILATIFGLIDGFCEWNYYVCRYERMTGKKVK